VILDLIPAPYRLLAVAGAAVALAAGGFGAGYKMRGVSADRDEAALKEAYGEQLRDALLAERKNLEGVLAVERAVREDIEGTANAERERAVAAEAVAADLAASRDSLRDALRRYSAARASAPGSAASAPGGTAANPLAGLVPGDVRDDMLSEGADALGVLAPALDAAKSKHAAIATLWEQARQRLKRLGEAGRDVPQ
jgi:hypothetical protein